MVHPMIEGSAGDPAAIANQKSNAPSSTICRAAHAA
jgi:hypothetical protein